MSDPRWKYGLIRSNWHKEATKLDAPILHGWQAVDVNDEGYTVFALGDALMRATMPRDRTSCEWIVFIDKAVTGYSGDLAKITEDVRKVLAERIPFDGRPYPQQDGSEIGEAGL